MNKEGTLTTDNECQEVVFGEEAQKKLLDGATVLANAVRVTMGPSGHNVIIDRQDSRPTITKDGVTVARSVKLKDRLKSVGAELIKEVASKTNDIAGDGTTTATVLAHEILSQGIKMIATNRSAVELKKGIDLATLEVVKFLKENAIAVKDNKEIAQVGTISANGDTIIGELLAEAMSKVGQDGIVTIESAKSVHTTLEVLEGMQFESGYVSPYFVTNSDKMSAELDNPLVLLTSKKISTVQEILPILDAAHKTKRALFIIADDIDGEALQMIILNKLKGALNICAVKAPSYGEHRDEILEDMATLVGGTVVTAASGVTLANIDSKQLGVAKKVIVTRGTTTLVSDPSNQSIRQKVEERTNNLRNLLQGNTLDEFQFDRAKTRLAKLSNGVAVIRVGGSTEVEMLERKDRVEDALNATQAASQEGIVPGGGTALYYASRHLKQLLATANWQALPDDVVAGIHIIQRACIAPMAQIVLNTGVTPEVVMSKLEDKIKQAIALESAEFENLKYNCAIIGYDAAKGEYCNLIERGIIDPVKVTRSALEYASSVVGLMLTCKCVMLVD
jgi:chaperonin GroEL